MIQARYGRMYADSCFVFTFFVVVGGPRRSRKTSGSPFSKLGVLRLDNWLRGRLSVCWCIRSVRARENRSSMVRLVGGLAGRMSLAVEKVDRCRKEVGGGVRGDVGGSLARPDV